MAASSPNDLAVAFRSIPSRVSEAQGELSPEAISSQTADIQADLEDAALLLATTSDPLRIADAIDAVPSDAWDAGVLDRLRALALRLGAHVRSMAGPNPGPD